MRLDWDDKAMGWTSGMVAYSWIFLEMRQMISLTGGCGHNSDRASFISWCEIHSVRLRRCFEDTGSHPKPPNDVRWSCLMVQLHHCWKLIRRHQIIVSARSNLLQIPCSLSRPEDGFMPQIYIYIKWQKGRRKGSGKSSLRGLPIEKTE